MSTIPLPHAIGLGLVCLLAAIAAASDLRCRRIPNAIPLALLAVLAVTRLATGQVSELATGLAVGAAVLAMGFSLHLFRIWGGGDAKLLAALAAWAGIEGVGRLVLVTAVAGGVIAMVIMLLRRSRGEASLPYGVAIAAGAVDLMFVNISV